MRRLIARYRIMWGSQVIDDSTLQRVVDDSWCWRAPHVVISPCFFADEDMLAALRLMNEADDGPRDFTLEELQTVINPILAANLIRRGVSPHGIEWGAQASKDLHELQTILARRALIAATMCG
jgi:hypothetical protein